MNGELIFALQRYNIFLEFATFRHIFLCGSVVVWELVYLFMLFILYFVDFICIYEIFVVPLQRFRLPKMLR